ncbi:MAG: hypothetical protein AUJ92_04170 [Armatimonadetes bacterium CG2_30_59_28]|nr:MAG: hypothetical protein AUJ92_04170 [Armatimonadetes bacterium CG2_30_59_28]PIX41719.1 MAG: hypothetical protein COZ56_11215 [Armatimonadetes bacterium CG_4_8_14_3_um_filter_58_9]PIY37851.1 MAG: hypothetical protein COZ05_21820 [Armatimonadetes bacterium CG_4_10_14_3_um_filter_59_10]PJB71962.1 MAG: hypothetical protein CO095_07480 [Armatimonadetes bacterium CG_4_9_14_3_um_filter_58_7]
MPITTDNQGRDTSDLQAAVGRLDGKVELLMRGTGWQPDILLTVVNGTQVVLKDFSQRGLLARTLGGILVRREDSAYRRLTGIPGLPRCFGRVGNCGLLIEYIEGVSVSDLVKDQSLPSAFFSQLYDIVDRIHAAGVAHGDLKRRKNLLVTHEDEVFLIDFAASWQRGRCWSILRNWFFRQVCQVDRNAVAKLKYCHAPDLLTSEEEQALQYPTRLERCVRRLFGR